MMKIPKAKKPRKFVFAFALPLATLLSGCGEPEDTEGLTAAEQRELDNDAARLDEARTEFETAMKQPPPAGEEQSEEP